jgi:hypothetical protein
LLIVTLVAIFVLGHASTATAQKPAPKGVQKLNPMNWRIPSFRLPNFMVAHDEQERIVERKNGLVTDVKSTASRSWTRTKQVFNPARLNPMNLFAGSATPDSGEKKPGFFSSMFAAPPAEPEERVATVNEWLGQERPK